MKVRALLLGDEGQGLAIIKAKDFLRFASVMNNSVSKKISDEIGIDE